MKVEFTYRNGKIEKMQLRYAKILQALKHGAYRDIPVEKAIPIENKDKNLDIFSQNTQEILISAEAKKLADENGIDVSKVAGTGKDNRITKSDVESAINAHKNSQV